MTAAGPTRDELERLRAAAAADDPDGAFETYCAVNERLGIAEHADPEWAMRLIADGCTMGLARLAGEEHFLRVPLHAETIEEAQHAAAENEVAA